MDSGGPYVMIRGAYQIPTWPVDSLDILVLSDMPQVAGQGERLFGTQDGALHTLATHAKLVPGWALNFNVRNLARFGHSFVRLYGTYE